ncbi:DUF6215 domain-containing protein [Streptomyces sp. NPDC047081]|uniref:DUF6215 domain-containing protein n=1 Tax=Streptomyces sp. NPDC047081 TaxID=3154706 RepID=UPI003408D559
MTEAVPEAEKGWSPASQAVAAVVVVGGLAALVWALGGSFLQQAEDRKPAVCEKSDTKQGAKHISGAQLCTALNRPDLPTLLGTPDEFARTAYGSDATITSADGSKTPAPEGNVDLDTYSLKLSVSDDDVPVSEMAAFLGSGAQTRTILGHPAVLYSDRTIALSLNLGGGKVDTGPGGIARSLIVARDAKDGGGFFEVSIWRQDDVTPDDTALLRVAEEVLPEVPGWTTG